MNNQILTVARMRGAEQALIDRGTSVDQLMQIAGHGAAEWVWRVAAGRPVTVLCGPRNNGGDGYVIAEALRARGIAVRVIAALPPATQAAKNARALFQGEIGIKDGAGASGVSGGVLVDCLFGSGLSRPLSPELAAMLRELADRHHRNIAIDLPSGVDSDSGALLGDIPQFDLTVALGAWKQAHFLMPAMTRMGSLELVDIGIDPAAGRTWKIARPRLSAPAADSHKYKRGLLAIVDGEMSGASLLAAMAAMRGGAGYVKLLSDHRHLAAPADLVVDDTVLYSALLDQRINAVLTGPGLGRTSEAENRLEEVLLRDIPTVLDADALVLLRPGMLAQRAAPLIVTPHEGEIAALAQTFGLSGDMTKVDRAVSLAQSMNAIVVAKGPDTLVVSPDGRMGFAGRSSSWLSTAGTGDVLAGTIASRLATGADPFDAACEGVWLHGEAARLAGPAFTAGILAEKLRDAYAATL